MDDMFLAAEISIKSYLISLFAGSFTISLIGSIALASANPLVLLVAFLVSFFVGALVILIIAAPIYAGLLSAGYANYVTSGLSAIFISVVPYFYGGIYLTAIFAAYGVPIALFAHFLASKECNKVPPYNPGPLRG